MSVVFSLIDAPYPQVCALYRCCCGAEATRYGEDAAVPPTGWTVVQPTGSDERVICPGCAETRAQRPS
jgi:hypothetical protein